MSVTFDLPKYFQKSIVSSWLYVNDLARLNRELCNDKLWPFSKCDVSELLSIEVVMLLSKLTPQLTDVHSLVVGTFDSHALALIKNWCS